MIRQLKKNFCNSENLYLVHVQLLFELELSIMIRLMLLLKGYLYGIFNQSKSNQI